MNTAMTLPNEIIDRLYFLDLTVANANGYRAALVEYRKRTEIITGAQADAVQLVHSAYLRSAVTTIMAVVDTPGKDRCSVGQLIPMLCKADLSVMSHRWSDPSFGAAELQRAKNDWATLAASAEYRACKDYRDALIAHTLFKTLPVIQDSEFMTVIDAAEVLTHRVFSICIPGAETFPAIKLRSQAIAKLFWDTYFKGIKVWG